MPDLNNAQEKLLDEIADHGEYVTEHVTEHEDEMSAIMRQIMTGSELSDPELFAHLGIAPELTIDDLLAVPLIERGPVWEDAFAGLIAAARFTAWALAGGLDFLKTVEVHDETVRTIAKPMSTADIKQAGKDGVRRERRDNAKARRAIPKPTP